MAALRVLSVEEQVVVPAFLMQAVLWVKNVLRLVYTDVVNLEFLGNVAFPTRGLFH